MIKFIKSLTLGLVLVAPTLSAQSLYFTAGGGTYASTSSVASEGSKKGSFVRGGLVGQMEIADYDVMLGIGGGRFAVSGDAAPREDVKTSAVIYDLSGYVWNPTESLSLGLGVEVLLAMKAHLQNAFSQRSQTAVFLGPRLKYDFTAGPVSGFASLQYSYGINAPHGHAATITALIGFELPLPEDDDTDEQTPDALPAESNSQTL